MNTQQWQAAKLAFAAAKAAGTTSATSVKAYLAEVKASPAPVVVETVVEVKPVVVLCLPAPVKKTRKSDHTRRIFKEELALGKLVRKTVLERFMAEAGLSFNGANTYLTNMKREHGLL